MLAQGRQKNDFLKKYKFLHFSSSDNEDSPSCTCISNPIINFIQNLDSWKEEFLINKILNCPNH